MTNFVVLHVFLIIELIGELKQLVNLSLLRFFDLICSLSPCWPSRALLFLASYGRSLAGCFLRCSLQVRGSQRLGWILGHLGKLIHPLFHRSHPVVVLLHHVICLKTLDLGPLTSGSFPEGLGLLLPGNLVIHSILLLMNDLLTKLLQEFFVTHKNTIRVRYTNTNIMSNR